ncbi:MAG: hypothetical protein AAFR41_07425 [Pseudomonadota bacterium]
MDWSMRGAGMMLIGLPIAEHTVPGATRFLPLGGDGMVQTAIVFAGAYLLSEIVKFVRDVQIARKK